MSFISDYLYWRGDLTFDKAPFNEIDNYIISKIGCPDFTGIVPEDSTAIDIGDAVWQYFAQDNSGLGVLASAEILRTLEKLPETPRFKDLRLSGFRCSTDIESEKQFSALTVLLPDGTAYISFRGTDDSIIGWKENFMMAILESVPAQKEALDYLTWAAESYNGDLIVGGHSKGGNLAVYAASRVSPEIQDRIVSIYNNDGPGFNDEFFEHEGYKRILDRLHHIVPQSSLIGTLLHSPIPFEVVRCPVTGPGSHDGFKWEVEVDRFKRTEELSILSRAFDTAIENTLLGMTREDTEEFIDNLFEILCSNGVSNLTELTEQKLAGLLGTLRKLRMDPLVRDFYREVIEMTLRGLRNRKESDHESGSQIG